jgi:hypothetical protein
LISCAFGCAGHNLSSCGTLLIFGAIRTSAVHIESSGAHFWIHTARAIITRSTFSLTTAGCAGHHLASCGTLLIFGAIRTSTVHIESSGTHLVCGIHTASAIITRSTLIGCAFGCAGHYLSSRGTLLILGAIRTSAVHIESSRTHFWIHTASAIIA